VRSSSGKIMTEHHLGCQLGEDGRQHFLTTVNVNDPAEKTMTNWSLGPTPYKVATINHLRSASRVPSSERPSPPSVAMQEARQALARESVRERLGHKTILGCDSVGTRSTRRIPAGEEGNELPLTVINEDWRCGELGISMLSIRDDPRVGKVTIEVTDVSRDEPDPSVFSPPADYVVFDPDAPVKEAQK
jgi:hypothetical protein